MSRAPHRRNIGFSFAIILGLVIGMVIKRVTFGLLIGIVLGLLAMGLAGSKRTR